MVIKNGACINCKNVKLFFLKEEDLKIIDIKTCRNLSLGLPDACRQSSNPISRRPSPWKIWLCSLIYNFVRHSLLQMPRKNKNRVVCPGLHCTIKHAGHRKSPAKKIRRHQRLILSPGGKCRVLFLYSFHT